MNPPLLKASLAGPTLKTKSNNSSIMLKQVLVQNLKRSVLQKYEEVIGNSPSSDLTDAIQLAESDAQHPISTAQSPKSVPKSDWNWNKKLDASSTHAVTVTDPHSHDDSNPTSNFQTPEAAKAKGPPTPIWMKQTPSGIDILQECCHELEHQSATRPVNDKRRSLIVLGTKNGGKTTMINCMTKKLEFVEPTVGLDFSCVRARTLDSKIKTCHIWEVGSDPSRHGYSALAKIPFKSCPCLPRTSIFLVIDLSQPELIWDVFHGCLDRVRSSLNKKLNKLKEDMLGQAKLIMEKRKKSFMQLVNGQIAESEQEFIDALPIPLTIIGTKYDLFEAFDIDKKSRICILLRLLAHQHGASLLFLSLQSTALKSYLARVFNYFAFEKSFGQKESRDRDQAESPSADGPLQILFGTDSFHKMRPNVPPEKFTKTNMKSLFDKKILGLGSGSKSESGSGSGSSEDGLGVQSPSKISCTDDLSKNPLYKDVDIDTRYELAMMEFSGSSQNLFVGAGTKLRLGRESEDDDDDDDDDDDEDFGYAYDKRKLFKSKLDQEEADGTVFIFDEVGEELKLSQGQQQQQDHGQG